MVGIYHYSGGLQFLGIIADTEEKAWEYLDKVYGKEINNIWYGCNKENFVIKEIKKV